MNASKTGILLSRDFSNAHQDATPSHTDTNERVPVKSLDHQRGCPCKGNKYQVEEPAPRVQRSPLPNTLGTTISGSLSFDVQTAGKLGI